jgi:transposase
MSKESRSYSKEFQEEAVKLAIKSPSIMHAARELGIPDATLYAWVKKLKAKAPMVNQPSNEVDINVSLLLEENRRLQKDNARLEEEKAILKKAAAYFAKELK